MASHRAHRRTAWPAALLSAALIVDAGAAGRFAVAAWLGALAALPGATAPDWLEWAWWRHRPRRWITHRSWTHWGLAWLTLLGGSYALLPQHPAAALLFGFAVGGCVHLLADWPNPLGVPWLWRRHALAWWNSGQCDGLVVALAWVLAGGAAYRTWGAAGRRCWLQMLNWG